MTVVLIKRSLNHCGWESTFQLLSHAGEQSLSCLLIPVFSIVLHKHVRAYRSKNFDNEVCYRALRVSAEGFDTLDGMLCITQKKKVP